MTDSTIGEGRQQSSEQVTSEDHIQGKKDSR